MYISASLQFHNYLKGTFQFHQIKRCFECDRIFGNMTTFCRCCSNVQPSWMHNTAIGWYAWPTAPIEESERGLLRIPFYRSRIHSSVTSENMNHYSSVLLSHLVRGKAPRGPGTEGSSKGFMTTSFKVVPPTCPPRRRLVNVGSAAGAEGACGVSVLSCTFPFLKKYYYYFLCQ